MELLRALVDVVVPVVIVAGVGFLVGRRLPIDLATVTKLGLMVLTPALALHTLLTTEVSGRVGGLLLGAFVVVTVVAAALGWLATWGAPGRARRSAAVAVAVGNNGNMGLPVALFALGRAGLDQAVLILLASVVVSFVLAPLLYGAHEGPAAALRGMLRLPALWAVAVGLLVRLTGVPVPIGVSRSIALLAQATVPVILLTLGIQLSRSGRVRLTRPVVTASLLRVAVLPMVALAVGYAVGLRGVPLQSLTLAAAMPTAVNAYLLATEYDGDVDLVAHTVTVSTLLSFGSAAVVTALLPAVGGL